MAALSAYEQYLKTVAQGQKDAEKAAFDEKQRQLNLAAAENERLAHEQISQAKASGTIGAEQRRIIDTMTGYGGSGAAVQRQIDAALSTDSATGRIHEALAKAKMGVTDQRASDTAAYNAALLGIDNQVKAALEKAKYDQLVEAAAAAQRQREAAVKAQNDAYLQSLKDAQNPSYGGYTADALAKLMKDNYTVTDPYTKGKAFDKAGARKRLETFASMYSVPQDYMTKVYFALGLSDPVIDAFTLPVMSLAQANKSDALTLPGRRDAPAVAPVMSLAQANKSDAEGVIEAQLIGLQASMPKKALSGAELTRQDLIDIEAVKERMRALIADNYETGKITQQQGQGLFNKYGL